MSTGFGSNTFSQVGSEQGSESPNPNFFSTNNSAYEENPISLDLGANFVEERELFVETDKVLAENQTSKTLDQELKFGIGFDSSSQLIATMRGMIEANATQSQLLSEEISGFHSKLSKLKAAKLAKLAEALEMVKKVEGSLENRKSLAAEFKTEVEEIG